MKKIIAFGIVVVFLCAGVVPSISGNTQNGEQVHDHQIHEENGVQHTVPLTLYVFEKTGMRTYTVLVSAEDVGEISAQFKLLREAMTSQPLSKKTIALQQEFINILDEKGVIPQEVTKEELISLLKSPAVPSFRYQK